MEFLPIVSMKASKNFKKDVIVMKIHFQLQGVGYEKNCFYQTWEHKPKLIDVLRKKVTLLGKFIYNTKIQIPNSHKIFHLVLLHDVFIENWDHLHLAIKNRVIKPVSVTCFQLSITIYSNYVNSFCHLSKDSLPLKHAGIMSSSNREIHFSYYISLLSTFLKFISLSMSQCDNVF